MLSFKSRASSLHDVYIYIAESTNLISESRRSVASGRGLGCGHRTVNFFSSMFTAVTTINPVIFVVIASSTTVVKETASK